LFYFDGESIKEKGYKMVTELDIVYIGSSK